MWLGADGGKRGAVCDQVVARLICIKWKVESDELMTITLQIDGKEIATEENKTILDIAKENGIDIPTICWHEATKANGLCRMCVVEVEGMRVLQPSCVVQASANMKVYTRNERVDRARKTILEMLASTMDLSDAPDILTMMDEYGASAERFPDAERRESEIKDDNPMYVRDYSKCLLCKLLQI